MCEKQRCGDAHGLNARYDTPPGRDVSVAKYRGKGHACENREEEVQQKVVERACRGDTQACRSWELAQRALRECDEGGGKDNGYGETHAHDSDILSSTSTKWREYSERSGRTYSAAVMK